ncbi:hypothetical protein DFJ73DRAFT_769103 [Zopfochytrium polystomum]|nr:hypothetical protein DFJ73DRAFT_769103 [Zopfochytrium polystomum]
MLGAFNNSSSLAPPRSPSRASNSSQSSAHSTSSVYSVHAPSASNKAMTEAKRASILSSSTPAVTDIDVSSTGPRMHHGFQQSPRRPLRLRRRHQVRVPGRAGLHRPAHGRAAALAAPALGHGPRLPPPAALPVAHLDRFGVLLALRAVDAALAAAKRASVLAAEAAEIDVAKTGPRMQHGFQHSLEDLARRVAAAKIEGGGDVTFVDPKTAGPRFKAPAPAVVAPTSVEILVSSADA